MTTLHLHRFAETKDGTLGRIKHWCTLEEENQNNQSRISSIPKGEYTCTRRMYNRGGYETFEVTGVPGRSAILFHKGNTEEDTEGCILLGTGFGAMIRVDEDTGVKVPKIAVTGSKDAFEEFMEEMDGQDAFTLVITGP